MDMEKRKIGQVQTILANLSDSVELIDEDERDIRRKIPLVRDIARTILTPTCRGGEQERGIICCKLRIVCNNAFMLC